MRTQHRKTLGKILLILFIVVCLFLMGRRDKSVDHYNRGLVYDERLRDKKNELSQANLFTSACCPLSWVVYESEVSHDAD